jgi:hypothetical protein
MKWRLTFCLAASAALATALPAAAEPVRAGKARVSRPCKPAKHRGGSRGARCKTTKHGPAKGGGTFFSHYIGYTSQATGGAGLGVMFDYSNRQVSNFAIAYHATCTNGQAAEGTRRVSGPLAVDAQGGFSFDGVTPSGATHYMASGRFTTPSHVDGTFRSIEKLTADGTPDPAGTVTCDTGNVTWSAFGRGHAVARSSR